MRRPLALLAAACLLSPQAPARDAAAIPPPGTGCPVFPADNVWHADVSRLPVHPRSAAWLASMGGPDRRLHPDFGPNDGGYPYGIPYEVVPSGRAKVGVTFGYADESDPGPYPFSSATPIEGGADADGDRHALMVDPATCRLYELYDAHWNGGAPTAGSGAVFDLRSNALRPRGWTSADAAGLPVFAGLLRRDEVLAGRVDHAVRVTASRTDRSYLWPARHFASATSDPNLPPMGAWFRLKAGFDVSRYRADTQVVLRAFQRHGMVLADNGSDWYFTGAADAGWDPGFLAELKSVPAGAFEAVDLSSLMVHPDSGQMRVARPSAAVAARDGQYAVRGLGSFSYGGAGDVPVMGDWDGDGVRTPGYVRGGVWHLRNASSAGGDSYPAFGYGRAGDVPVVGDWNGDGRDTVGVVRGGVWYLRDSLSGGAATVPPFGYGRAGDTPVVGDWNADRRDTVGVVRGTTWYLRDASSGGANTVPAFGYGRLGDVPVPADWNGDRRDTPGVVRGNVWYARNANSAGTASYPAFAWGSAGDTFLRG